MLKFYLYPFKTISLVLLAITGFYACSPSHSEDTATEKRAFVPQQNLVDTLILKSTTFHKEIVSNGKLKALQKSELKFSVGGQLQALPVKNGQLIQKGAIIASLDPFEFQQRLDQAETQLKNSHLELRDVLMGQGYTEADSLKVPKIVYDGASVRSGYTAAQRDLKTAKYELASTVLEAPFTGKVANIKQKVYEQVSPGEVFCVLINDSEFEVEFHLVESEIHQVQVGDEVKVIPYSVEQVFKGRVSQINPMVDEHGLVMVKARVKNPGSLMEGMNVKVLVANEVPNKLVVPKASVVLRQNQEVLFKYEGGKAIWTYIQTGDENSTSYAVIAHPDKGGSLKAGDTVIISGNLNLAHESEVMIK